MFKKDGVYRLGLDSKKGLTVQRLVLGFEGGQLFVIILLEVIMILLKIPKGLNTSFHLRRQGVNISGRSSYHLDEACLRRTKTIRQMFPTE